MTSTETATARDEEGPPNLSSVYEQWTRQQDEIFHKRITDLGVTKPDLIKANTIHKNEEFVLTLALRNQLYNKVFRPISSARFVKHSLSDERVTSKTKLIYSIEGFLLAAFEKIDAKVHGNGIPLPPLSQFAEEVVTIAKTFKETWQSLEYKVYSELVEATVSQFWLTWKQRNERFKFGVDIHFVRDYYCGLLDTIFGYWPAPGQRDFHDGELKRSLTGWTTRGYYEPTCLVTELAFFRDKKVMDYDEAQDRAMVLFWQFIH